MQLEKYDPRFGMSLLGSTIPKAAKVGSRHGPPIGWGAGTLPEELSLVDSAPHDPTDMTFTVGQGLLDLRTSPHSPQPYPLSFEESCSAHARQALW